MSWQDIAIPMLRATIFDLDCSNYTYSDGRLLEILIVAAYLIRSDIAFTVTYAVDIPNVEITPDPSDDIDFIHFLTLKSACMLDLGSARTAAYKEGLTAKCGPASLTVSGHTNPWMALIQNGYCKTYDESVFQFNLGNASYVRAIMSPFINTTFDPTVYSSNFNKHNFNQR